MANDQAISSHGTIIEVQLIVASGATRGNATTAWTRIPLLGDVQMPGLSRNEFATDSQDADIDKVQMGILRRTEVTAPLWLNSQIPVHDALTMALIKNTFFGVRVTSPVADGTVLIFSSYVKGVPQTNPADGIQKVDLSLRASGNFIRNGIEYGDNT